MIDRDLALEKVANIQKSLRRIKETTRLDPASLDNVDIQDIFVLNLQRAIQSAIDLAGHIAADEGLGLPGSLKECFSLLETAGILPAELAARMRAMVGFRNIAVHEYEALDLQILKAILRDHLADLEGFSRRVLEHYHLKE